MTEARIRAPVTKAIVEMIDELPPADRDAIRQAAGPSIDAVEQALRSSWLPLATQLETLHAIDQRLGRAGYLDFCQRHFIRTVETPLVRAVFDGAVRLFGMGPEAVFKVFRRSWAMMSTHAGEVNLVELTPEHLRIEVRALPLEEARASLFIEGFAATFTGVFRLFEIDGKAELTSVDYPNRTAVYTGSWTAKPG
jgi:hypothetical protein